MDTIIQFINQSERIAVLTHISEDADALGSAAAFAKALKGIEKTVDIYISEAPEDRLALLGNDFILFDEEMELPAYDLCVCLDCADLERLGSRIRIFNDASRTINIDHHFTNPNYADANLVMKDASSVGEVVFLLLREMEIEITQEIAKCLYVSISADTGCFKYSNVSPQTMEIVAELLKQNIDHAAICKVMFSSEKREVMRFRGHLMENIIEYFDGKLCIVQSNDALLKRYGVNKKDIGDIVDIPRKIEGCEIAASVREYGEEVKISFRSNGRYDVSDLALAFGGGGHKMAAGATVFGSSAEQVIERIVYVCKEILTPEEGLLYDRV